MTRHSKRLSPGALTAIAIGVATALAVAAGAFGEDRLTIERTGDHDGRPVVFIPGLATPGAVFQDAAASAPEADSHIVTLGGFGGLPAPASIDPFIEPAAQALADYLESHAMTDVILVGHSLGGQVALIAAGAAPERVSHVMVVDSAPFFAGLMQPAADPAAVTSRREMMIEQMAGMGREAFLAMMRQGLPAQAAGEASQARIFEWAASSDQTVVAVAAAEIFAGDLRHHLDAVSAPVTLIYPRNAILDAEEFARRYQAQYERLDRFDMRPADDSRHFVMLDQPERFHEELARIIGGDEL
jgi:pimeloyl-ACP methyl ester carboxylesterase